jgi:TRAP-type uncharacterized transport system fused permease subunit
MAEVTPPVCIASYCGAAIAGTKPLATGFEASLLAIMGYIIPFVFVYNPALILNGPVLDVIATFLLMIVVSGLWSATFSGYLFKKLNLITRFVMGFATAGLVVLASTVKIMTQLLPQMVIILATIALIAAFFVLNKRTKRALAM